MLVHMELPPKPRQQGLLRHLFPRGGHLLALAVLLGSLLIVYAAWQLAREREMRAANVEFVAHTAEAADLMHQRLVQYELVTRAGAALFASVERPTPQQWEAYVAGLHLAERFPAIVGLGFAGYVRDGHIDRLQLEWKDAGYGLLDIHPRGVRNEYGPILYLEPRTAPNAKAFGFDMFSDPTRRQAMQASMESGEARLSGAVNLVQDLPRHTVGVLLYLPVYRNALRPQTPDARRDAMQGWVYIPFRVESFVAAALGRSQRETHLRLYDVTDAGERLLFANVAQDPRQPPAFRYSRTLTVYGRLWRFDFESEPLDVAVPGLGALHQSVALGLVVSLLLYGLTWLLARTEVRARDIAMVLTEDLRRSEVRFRSAMQYSANGKVLLDSRGSIVEANPALAAMVGRSAASLVGRDFESLFERPEPGEDTGGADAEGVVHSTRRLRALDGLPRHAQLTYSPIPGNVGQDIAALVQVEDVTERLRAEARVHALNRTLEARVALRTRELQHANQELETFAYSVSHDLRAPLRAIDGFSRILAERYAPVLDESARDYLGRVRRAAARMGELIDAMLKMARLSRGEMKLETVDLSAIASEIFYELRAEEPEREVEWVVAAGLATQGDAALLRNLLDNLIGNAWKFTRECQPARIEFGVEHGSHGAEYFVRDNGAGFQQAYVDKLFRPFQRLHTQEAFDGHGVGLATVKRIVERHGGHIRAEGRPGEGATFHFTLNADSVAG